MREILPQKLLDQPATVGLINNITNIFVNKFQIRLDNNYAEL